MSNVVMESDVMLSIVMLSIAVPFYPITRIFNQPFYLSARGGVDSTLNVRVFGPHWGPLLLNTYSSSSS